MRHPCSDSRAAQFMFASPSSAKQVRTSSAMKALARMSYTRGFIGGIYQHSCPHRGREPAELLIANAAHDAPEGVDCSSRKRAVFSRWRASWAVSESQATRGAEALVPAILARDWATKSAIVGDSSGSFIRAMFSWTPDRMHAARPILRVRRAGERDAERDPQEGIAKGH